MFDNTLTIALEGDVLLKQFAITIQGFTNLVDLLSREVAEEADIEWLIDDLHAGSALATIAGISQEEEPVQRVIQAFSQVGRSLQRREPIPYSNAVARQAANITKILDGKVTAVRFETAETDSIIYGVFDADKPASRIETVSFGTVKGRVQALTSRGNLKFTLYDSIFDKAVTCYLQAGQEDVMKEIWGKLVTVSGRVTREPDFGRAISVRNITSIDPVIEVEPGAYKQAKGIFFDPEDHEPAEVTIRRIRDAED